MKTYYILLISITIISCGNNKAPDKHTQLPNDASINHIHGYPKTINETRYYNVEMVDNDYFPDNTEYSKTSIIFNETGFITASESKFIQNNNVLKHTKDVYEQTESGARSWKHYKNDTIMHSAKTQVLNPKKVETIFYNNDGNPQQRTTYELNAKYRTAKKISLQIGTPDSLKSTIVTTNNYHIDSLHYYETINLPHSDYPEIIEELHYYIIEKDQYNNPTKHLTVSDYRSLKDPSITDVIKKDTTFIVTEYEYYY